MKSTEEHIEDICSEICEMLCEKNRSYGDSAVNPQRVFASPSISAVELINIRLDDKINRLKQGNGNHFREDVEADIMGYLILKRVALRIEQEKAQANNGAARASATDMEIVTGAGRLPDRFEGEAPNDDLQCIAVNDAGQRCDFKAGHEGNHANCKANMIWARRVTA